MDIAPDRVEAIFTEAQRQPDAAERAAYVARACGDDARLRSRIEALLRAHDLAGNFMAAAPPEHRPGLEDYAAPATLDIRKPAEAHRDGILPERPGAVIGHYKLLQRIGEGGFGVVWMADQLQPVRRRVALKIIKAGMDTRQVIARFEQERQALAMMDHPGIARVLDAGATQTGRPYFVMELVRGVKITDYCDEQGLPTAERIELFIKVCQAVQHAHQKGIIHRDLKPSNILVTINDGEAVPKVIDFGVAKATQGRLTDGTLFTQFEQMIGTPLYMSPEQAEMTSLDVDTRSDIYALGVLLYELLTGRTPIDTATMAKAGMAEIRRLIREVDPPRPSARLRTLDGNELTTVAKRRHADAAKLPGSLRGDLDWIVMKCLEKDRKRRYDTANGLAMDLRRHLGNDVVTARPPTTAYLLSKLVRRNRLAFAASVAVLVTLVVGVAASVWQAVRATRAERRAVAVLDELRASAPAFAEQARALAAKEQFGDAIEKLDYALKLRPDAAEYLLAKADLLQCQFKFAEAATVYRAALRLKPGLARAEASAKVCDELLAAPPGPDGKLTRESLAKLHLAMQQQQRPAAELMPVARLLGEEKKLLLDYWLGRLKDLPVSAERPLKERLTLRDDGRLALDLSDTKIIDLSPLAGVPLAALNVSSTKERGELADLSPLAALPLVELNVSGTSVADLTPIREMHTLQKLETSNTRVSDLAALAGLRLKHLTFMGCPVRDLKPIRQMPLEEIHLSGTRVADLSPLVGMPVKSIDLSMTPVQDFSPLAGLPLEKCYMQRNRIADLSVLRGKPLKELVLWACEDARNYAVLGEIKTLELLLLPSSYRNLPTEDYESIGALRGHPKLRQIGSEVMNQMAYATTGSKDLFWQDWDREQTFVPALRKTGVKFSLFKLPAGTYYLGIQNQPLRDLSFLAGAPISHLDITGCPVSDLSPIRDLRLEVFYSNNETLADLSPLRGMPLKTIFLAGSPITDLSPLTGLPLRNLYVGQCTNVADVAALAEIATLENLTVPATARNIESLRKLRKLQRLAYRHPSADIPDTTAAEFWKEYDGQVWLRTLRAAGVPVKAATQLPDRTWSVDLANAKAFTDLSVLKGAPISRLYLVKTGVSDLSPLRGMPLKHLFLDGTSVADLGPLQGMPLEELRLSETKVTDVSALRGMPLQKLDVSETQVADLRPLEGLALTSLRVRHTRVTDLTPLRAPLLSSSLRDLDVSMLKATDLSPVAACAKLETLHVFAFPALSDLGVLRGLKLQVLWMANTSVSDLSPLAGMPLTELFIDKTPITDVSPLLQCPTLKRVILPGAARDVVALRDLPALERISYLYRAGDGPAHTAEDFWNGFGRESATAHVSAGRLAEGRKGFEDAMRLQPENSWTWFEFAILLAQVGDTAAYRAHCHAMVAKFGNTADPAEMDRVAKPCLLLPIDDADRATAVRLAEAVAAYEGHDLSKWFRLCRGLGRYRAGQYAPAVETLAGINDGSNDLAEVPAMAVLAMARHRLGKAEEARETLKSAEARAAEKFPKPGDAPGDAWRDVFVAQMLLREAREVVGKP